MNCPNQDTLASEKRQDLNYHLREFEQHVQSAEMSWKELKLDLDHAYRHLKEAICLNA